MSQKGQMNEAQKARKKLMIENTVIVLVVICVFGFFGYTVVNRNASNHVETHYVNTNAISDYMNSVDSDDSDDSDKSSTDESSTNTESSTETTEEASTNE